MNQDSYSPEMPSQMRLKTGLRFGLVTSAISSCILIALYYTGLSKFGSSSESWIPFILSGTGIYLATDHYKKFSQGYMAQKDVVVVSVWLGLFSGILSGLIMILQLKLDPKVIAQMENTIEMQLEQKGIEGADLENFMAMSSIFYNPFFLEISSVITSLITSLVLGFLLSFILRKEKSNPFD